MALGDAYATPTELAIRLGTEDNGTFASLLAAASREVEGFCRRQFNKTTTATERRFRSLDAERTPVDDFHTTTGLIVEVDGTVWAAADVDPRPWDGVYNGQPGWPFFDLFAVDRIWPTWDRRATVTVTAQWGWTAVPEQIKQATLRVASRLSLRSGGRPYPYPVQSESVDGYSIGFDTSLGTITAADVPSELADAVPYRRKRFGVA